MIRKPSSDWGQEHSSVIRLRLAGTAISTVVRWGLICTRTLLIFIFAVLFGLGALVGLIWFSLPAFFILGGMAAAVWWCGRRALATAIARGRQ
jgi:hypothetical protein